MNNKKILGRVLSLGLVGASCVSIGAPIKANAQSFDCNNNTDTISIQKEGQINNNKHSNGWRFIDNNWYFYKNNNMVKSCRMIIDNDEYSFDKDGKMQTGWISNKSVINGEIGVNWRYFYPDGRAATNTIIDGCILDDSGLWDTDQYFTRAQAIKMVSKIEFTPSYLKEPYYYDISDDCPFYIINGEKVYLVEVREAFKWNDELNASEKGRLVATYHVTKDAAYILR